MDKIAKALQPYGNEYIISVTAVLGPGGMVVVFCDPGDCYTAYLTHDYEVVWVMNSGGSDAGGYTDETNAFHAASRTLHMRASS